jgi:DNA-binding phage protein
MDTKQHHLWDLILARINAILASRRGAKSEVAKSIGIDRQALQKILSAKREPGARLAFDLWEAAEREAKETAARLPESIRKLFH